MEGLELSAEDGEAIVGHFHEEPGLHDKGKKLKLMDCKWNRQSHTDFI